MPLRDILRTLQALGLRGFGCRVYLRDVLRSRLGGFGFMTCCESKWEERVWVQGYDTFALQTSESRCNLRDILLNLKP